MKKMTKKVRKPAMSSQRYSSMIVQVCDQRIRLHNLIEEVSQGKPRWSTLIAELEEAKIAIERVEERLAKGSRRDFPSEKLPRVCINRGST